MKYIKDFPSILDAMPDALIIVNARGEIIYFNAQAEILFGYSSADTLGQSIEILIPERYLGRHKGHLIRYFEHPRTRPMGAGLELYGKKKNGQEFPIEISLSPLESEAGLRALAAIRDITDRKKAEAKFKGILEATPDALVIINQAGNIVLVNAQAEKIFGFNREELLNHSINQLIPERYHERHHRHLSRYFEHPHTRPMGKGLELYGKRKNGQEFPIEISLSPLEAEEGLLGLAAVRDITDRKKAEAKFKGILEAMPDALVIINQTGNIVLVNTQAEALFGFNRSELLDKHVDLLIPERYQGRHQGHIAKYFEHPRVRPMGAGLALYGKKSTGQEFPIEISLSPLDSEEGMWALAAIRDATERKCIEQTLQEKNLALQKTMEQLESQALERLQAEKQLAEQRTRAKLAEEYKEKQNEFINTICHEIRNPLNVIYGSIDLLNEKINFVKNSYENIPVDPKVKDFFHQCEEDLAAMKESSQLQKVIVDDVLDFSKLESGKIELHSIPFSLQKMIYATIKMFSPQIKEKNLDLQISLPKKELWLKTDVFRLKQIMTNVLSNAVKFTHKGSIQITVRLQPISQLETILQVTVRDTGVGMTSEEVSRLFKRFGQASSKVAATYGGSGLGLLICKKLTKKMGGNIHVQSAPDKGSKFIFTIRCAYLTPEEKKQLDQEKESLETASQKSQDRADSIFGSANKTILIVEDSKLNQRILKSYLEKKGYYYQVANNGAEALELYDKLQFDIILMDIEMPVMGGLEATKLIRLKEKHLDRKTPIIGLSGNARTEQILLAKSSGMSDYLTKPYHKEHLYQVIEKYSSPLTISEKGSKASSKLHLSTYQHLSSLGNYLSLGIKKFEDTTKIKKTSAKWANKEENIGPRHLPGFYLKDVHDVGNCFYETIAAQMQLINHPFIQRVPSGTDVQDSLRLAIQGKAFQDRQWADNKTFDLFVKKFDLILAVIDTRNPKAGFVCYYLDADGEVITNAFGDMPLPNKPIIKIAATGNHFLSVESHPPLEKGAIRHALKAPIPQALKSSSNRFFTKWYDNYIMENRDKNIICRTEFDKRFGLIPRPLT